MFIPLNLEDTNLVSNVHSLILTTHTHKGLLETQGRDYSIHLRTLYIVKLANGMTNLSLVCTDIHKESKDVLRLQYQGPE